MSRTVLFFGDSNTRGYGVGRRERFAALIEAQLARTVAASWRVAVAATESDLRVIPERLDLALTRYAPDVLVWQCPTGPAAYFVAYPPWARRARALYALFFERLRERAIRRDVARAGGDARRSRHDALYEGLYVDRLYRWRPASWPGTRYVNGWLAARYGTRVKATCDRYVAFVTEMRDRVHARGCGTILFLGLLPHSDLVYPGYMQRARAWNERLEAALHRAERGDFYLDVTRHFGKTDVEQCLLSDGAHLTRAGHRRVAEIVLATLPDLLRARDAA